ncbi:class I SAM-dependent methyltransferase [Streptomyces sp. NPDC047023]|uniref:class I SAM-dependent methyltransferase n=1 Tax=Streptomyces sp. NPDC047023 TaxID=3155139 RepID=UPI0033F1B38E
MTAADGGSAADWDAFNEVQKGRSIAHSELQAFRQRVPLREGAVVLDIRCGNGAWTRELSKLGAKVTGYDWAPRTVERAGRFPTILPRPRYAVWDVMSQDPPEDIEPGTVDLVTFRHALASLDAGKVLPLMAATLAPGGRIYVLTDVRGNDEEGAGRWYPSLTLSEVDVLGSGWDDRDFWPLGKRTGLVLRGYGI